MTADVQIHLSDAEALVLFEWLAHRDEVKRLERPVGDPLSAEEVVLLRVEAQLEKMVQVFDPGYHDLLASARRKVLED